MDELDNLKDLLKAKEELVKSNYELKLEAKENKLKEIIIQIKILTQALDIACEDIAEKSNGTMKKEDVVDFVMTRAYIDVIGEEINKE